MAHQFDFIITDFVITKSFNLLYYYIKGDAQMKSFRKLLCIGAIFLSGLAFTSCYAEKNFSELGKTYHTASEKEKQLTRDKVKEFLKDFFKNLSIDDQKTQLVHLCKAFAHDPSELSHDKIVDELLIHKDIPAGNTIIMTVINPETRSTSDIVYVVETPAGNSSFIAVRSIFNWEVNRNVGTFAVSVIDAVIKRNLPENFLLGDGEHFIFEIIRRW